MLPMETFTARDAMQKASEPRVMGLDVVLDFCSAVMCKFILAIYLCTSFLYFTKKTFNQILFSSDCTSSIDESGSRLESD